MRTSPINRVIDHLRRTVPLPDGAGLDGELLGNFIERHDESALAALVKRHGSMVWGVCRRLLTHHDAEDAFQATLLVLVRKAASIRSREMVGNWLYGVAHQTALLARRTAARRRAREAQVTNMPDIEAVQRDQWAELRPLLDEELSRLPEIYRAVIVLCELESRSRKETARQLGVPEGTVAGRLARARVMLAKRLIQRGVMLSGGALAAILSQNVASAGVPTLVMSNTIKVASLIAAGQMVVPAVVPVKVVALAEGVIKAMLITKFKMVTAALLVAAAVGIGGGLISRSPLAAQAADERLTKGVGERRVGQTRVGSISGAGVDGSLGHIDLARGPQDYKAFFNQALGVMGEYFEQISYANQYDGRIEALTVPIKDQPNVVRRGVIKISASDEGGFSISVRVYKAVAEGDQSRPAGHDTELERAILQRLNVQPNQKEKTATAPSAGSRERDSKPATSSAFTRPQGPAATQVVRIAATVNGEAILAEEVYSAAYLSLPDAYDLAAPDRSKRIMDLWRETLDRVVEREVIVQAAFRALKARNALEKLQEVAANEFGRRWVRTAIKNAGLRDAAELSASLRARGTSLDTVRRQWDRDFIAEEYLQSRVFREGEGARQERARIVAELKRQAVIEYAASW